mmetsp:Transcript_10304/g.14559  ORF Transcript_10304/g.14559 Transcript_10304/m.14559 type:complete len:98 (-) Transcript_10304:236-529(-)
MFLRKQNLLLPVSRLCANESATPAFNPQTSMEEMIGNEMKKVLIAPRAPPDAVVAAPAATIPPPLSFRAVSLAMVGSALTRLERPFDSVKEYLLGKE